MLLRNAFPVADTFDRAVLLSVVTDQLRRLVKLVFNRREQLRVGVHRLDRLHFVD